MVNNKILIATHKLGTNYGGIMQAYALQEKMREISGCLVVTTDMSKSGFVINIARWVKFFIKKATFRKEIMPPSFEDKNSKNNRLFIQKHIKTISQKDVLSGPFLKDVGFLVVGSDQVWRQAYVPVDKYMFSFVKDDSIPRISYAASFGKDDLSEYSSDLINKTAKLAKKFKAISVREKSGINIVKNNWGMEADYHVDPALLFDANHYNKLIDEDLSNLTRNNGGVFAYVLDREGEKGKIIDKVARKLGSGVFEILPKKPKNYREYKKNPEKYNLSPVTQWLKSFHDADFIVTDSFHGCVFSIIYNKPFLAIANKDRGLARFTSLLDIFGLNDRLVSSYDDVSEDLIDSKVDWGKVNSIIKKEQERSYKYLKENLDV